MRKKFRKDSGIFPRIQRIEQMTKPREGRRLSHSKVCSRMSLHVLSAECCHDHVLPGIPRVRSLIKNSKRERGRNTERGDESHCPHCSHHLQCPSASPFSLNPTHFSRCSLKCCFLCQSSSWTPAGHLCVCFSPNILCVSLSYNASNP